MSNLYTSALTMLQWLEWSATIHDDGCFCPVCWHDADGYLHDPDCELFALIKKMETTPMECRPVGTAARVLRAEISR